MKKLLISLFLMTILFVISSKTMAQFDISASVVKYNIDAGNVSDFGWGIGFQVKNFYLDLSINTANGKGEYLEFSSDRTYPIDKKQVGCINIGYNVLSSERFKIIPCIGWIWTSDIYQDPIGWDTYYTQLGKSYVNMGIIFKYYTGDHFGIVLGAGTIEQLKASICYKF